METTAYHETNSPPMYNERGYEQMKEMELRKNPSQHIQSTVVTIMPEGPPIRDHIIWSLFNAMYFNICCLGVFALIFSVKSRDRKMLGDKKGAASYGSRARSINIAAAVLSVLFFIVALIIFIAQMSKMVEVLEKMNQDALNHKSESGLGFGNGK